jgi:transcriptional regulator with XRE-family HTH domain
MAKKVVKPVDAHVGALVRKRRVEVCLSQEKLGDAIGLTFQQIQKYEKGTNRISSSRLMQIANTLKVPVTYFFERAPAATRITARASESMDYIADFVASKDGTALMKAFVRLPADVRRSIVNLVEQISENE